MNIREKIAELIALAKDVERVAALEAEVERLRQPVPDHAGLEDRLFKVVYPHIGNEFTSRMCAQEVIAALGRAGPVACPVCGSLKTDVHSDGSLSCNSCERHFATPPAPQPEDEGLQQNYDKICAAIKAAGLVLNPIPDGGGAWHYELSPQPALALIEELTAALNNACNVLHQYSDDEPVLAQADAALASAKRFKGE